MRLPRYKFTGIQAQGFSLEKHTISIVEKTRNSGGKNKNFLLFFFMYFGYFVVNPFL
jgi:hypothetical protein